MEKSFPCGRLHLTLSLVSFSRSFVVSSEPNRHFPVITFSSERHIHDVLSPCARSVHCEVQKCRGLILRDGEMLD